MPQRVTRNRFEAPIDQETVAADWQARGYSCHIFIDPPGQQWNGYDLRPGGWGRDGRSRICPEQHFPGQHYRELIRRTGAG